jgi:hypothetical protein
VRALMFANHSRCAWGAITLAKHAIPIANAAAPDLGASAPEITIECLTLPRRSLLVSAHEICWMDA